MAEDNLVQDLSLGSHRGYLPMPAVQTGFHRGKGIDLNYELGKPVTPLGNVGSGAELS